MTTSNRRWRAIAGSVVLGIGVVAVSWLGAYDGEPRQTADGPDPDAAAVWQYLQDEGYAGSWEMWPGTEARYEGGQPHGARLTTYVTRRPRTRSKRAPMSCRRARSS